MTLSTSGVSGTSATQLTGLASGLDTSSIVASLMAAASQPQVLLNNQITALQSTVSALQSLNSQFASLTTMTTSDVLDPTSSPLTLAAFTTSSTNSAAAMATASSAASTGSLSFSVDRLAQAQVEVTGAYSSWAGGSAFTIATASGSTSITAASSSMTDIAAAINNAGVGVTAQAVAAGTDSNGNQLYRLQLSSSQTGAAGAFTVTDASGTDLSSGGATISSAQDAQITLWPGTSAAQSITSSSNTFSNVVSGVNVTVAATSSTPVTIGVAQDTATSATTAQSLVTAVNAILASITQGSATSTTTDSSGNTQTVLGAFTVDSTVQGSMQQLTDAMTLDLNGTSPSAVGISLNDDGTIAFDPNAFQAALQSNPQQTTALFNQIVSRVNTAATAASDPYAGSLTNEISSDNDNITSMQAKSADMTTQLQQQQTMLEQQFSYMETMMSQIQSQGSYLTQYFAALDGSSSSSSSSSTS